MVRISRKSLVVFLSLSLLLWTMVIGIKKAGFQAQVGQISLPDEELDNIFYLPVILGTGETSKVTLTEAQTINNDGELQNIFYLWDTILYAATGVNNHDEAVSVNLVWTLDGPCGPTDVFSDTVILQPGEWEYAHDQITPGCNGAFTAKLQVEHLGITNTLNTTYLVNLEQGFDRCGLPSVNDMQVWWDASPYTVWNIYLGGVHFPCSLQDLTPEWVDSVAQQGWDFILTWVGPQAPCSSFHTTFSSDWVQAYFDGVDEADKALAAADALGISGDRIIYYDLEGYPEGFTNPACRYAAAMFIQGWTQELQSNGVQAGAYGSPCNSYMTDWASNQPPPDDVWIAHWLLPPEYRPDASVWDVSCMSNDYWPNHQRIRQYAGDHVETWGGVGYTIDSNVVDGETVKIPPEVAVPGSDSASFDQEPLIQDFDLVSPDIGWTLIGNRLLLTEDRGIQWQDVTPDLENGMILDVAFLDKEEGWIVGADQFGALIGKASLYHTLDGGRTWDSISLPLPTVGISSAYLNFLDPLNGWVVLKLASGSSFSLGQMYITRDGGVTWNERPAPLGEPAAFVDELHGWMMGGPDGGAVFQTLDGGLTWEPYVLPGLPDGKVYVGQPYFDSAATGILPVTVVEKSQTTLLIYLSDEDGERWRKTQEVPLSPDFRPGSAIPFHVDVGKTWSAVTDFAIIQGDVEEDRSLSVRPGLDLPPGTLRMDFSNGNQGWALVQNGTCNGDKIPGYRLDAELLRCSQTTRLYGTEDGGIHWTEIQLPGE